MLAGRAQEVAESEPPAQRLIAEVCQLASSHVALALLPFALCLASTSTAQAPPPRIETIEEWRLDADAEDLPGVNGVYVGAKSQIVVPIPLDMQLRVYDSTGRRVAVLGRRGSGPGEFRSIGGVGWFHDTLWVADLLQRRTTFFGPDHALVRSERWPSGRMPGVARGGEISAIAPAAMLDSGAVLSLVRWIPRDDRDVAGAQEAAFVVRASDGGIRPVLILPSGRDAPWVISTFSCCSFPVPFALWPQYSITPDGHQLVQLSAPLPTGPNGRFRIVLADITGDTLFSRFYPYRAEPIPGAAQDSALNRVVPAPGHLIDVPRDLPERVRAEARARMPSWYIAVESVLLGLDGTIWIGFRPANDHRRYLALSSRGDPVGELGVPAATRLRQASASHIWVTETDADGLSDVVRYRLRGLACRPDRC